MSFDPEMCITTKHYKYDEVINGNHIHVTNKMNALSMTLFAMLLSMASARRLKTDCTEDYQSPHYWGKCVNGTYAYTEKNPTNDSKLGCGALVILVPKDAVGNNILTIKTDVKHGALIQDLTLNEYNYYSVKIEEGSGLTSAEISIEFFLNGGMVHNGTYTQTHKFFSAGDITTTDCHAETYSGSCFTQTGHIIIKSLEQCP